MACLQHHTEAALLGFSDAAERSFPEPGVEPNYGPSRTCRIERIDLRLDLWPEEQRYVGAATIRVAPLPSFSGEVVFDLDEAIVDAVTDEAGRALAWSHEDAKLVIHGVDAPAGIVVRWHGERPPLGLYFTGPTPDRPDRQHMAWTQCQDDDCHFFVPCHDDPRVKHAWGVTLTGPLGYTLLSNGQKLEEGARDGRSYAVFEQTGPMPPYLFTAVAAKLSVVETAWRDRPVRYLVPVGEEEHALRGMGKTPQMMEHFSRLTGVDYPWARYDQVVVHDFVFGGMENVACTTMTDLLLVDEKAALEWDADGLVAHELAHQWFGDLVTCQDWSQAWLNESWATFMEGVWVEHDRGAHDATWTRWIQARDYLEEDGGRYRRPIVDYRYKSPVDVFDRHLYQKGANVLNTLRATLGEDAFWVGVQTYLERHGNDTVHSRHFQRAMEDATGKNLDRFFAEWIHGAGHPKLQVKLAQDEGLVTVTVKQTQEGEATAAAFAFPLRLVLVPRDGAPRAVDLPVKERERTWAIPVDGPIATVRVDPGFRVLAEIALEGPRGWLVALLDDACPVVAVRAGEALLKEGSEAAFRAVVKALADHPDRHVREDLARQIGERGSPEARDILLGCLKVEPDPRVRRSICTALGRFREPAVADALLAVVAAGPETWHLLGAALESLGKTRDPRARAAIEAHLGVECWGEIVRGRAIQGLGATEDAGVLDTLLGCTRHPWPERVRVNAAVALGALGDKVESVREAATDRLIEMLEESGFRPRFGALSGLDKLKAARAIPAIERLRRSGLDGRIQRQAYETARSIRKGRTGEESLAGVRRRLDEVAETNADLRQRLGKLESRFEKPTE